MRFCLLCTAAVLVMAAILSGTSSAAIRGQRIEVANLPEDGAKPFLMVFTQDPPTTRDQFALDSITGFGIGEDVRFHHIRTGRQAFDRWASRHHGQTPFVAIVSADRAKILRQVDAAEMPATAGDLMLMLMPTAEDEAKGRLFPLLPWRRRIVAAVNDQPVAPTPAVVTVTRDTLPSAPDPRTVAEMQPAGLLDTVDPIALLLSILGGGAAGGAIQWRRSLAA